MPRVQRLSLDGAILHLTNRGNDRRLLFNAPRDYLSFLALIALAQGRTDLRLLGYVLMPNHWHLVAWPSTAAQLSQFMQRLTGAHAAILRQESATIGDGHVYQGRYHAVAITTEPQLLRTLRYVEANPVRAGLVARAEMWRWSSLDERLGTARLIVDPPVPLPPSETWTSLVNAAGELPRSAAPIRPKYGIAKVWADSLRRPRRDGGNNKPQPAGVDDEL